MSELEDMMGKILGDPEEMAKISRLASSIFGTEQDNKAGDDMGGLFSALMGKAGSGGDKAALVAALAPYLKPERRRKLEKALKISRIAGIAGIALNEWGEGDV
ncbi:MAG: hypothetical protein E7420_07350 [Ruminococcaceae bacterium]|nr:hypothetical protein [Oscillospiraceae bacterium]